MQRADTRLIKKLNEIRLLHLLRDHSPISRNELARRAHISKVAASDIVARLDRAGFIITVGKGETTRRGGKPPILLKLNPESGYVGGIEIKRQRSLVALGNVESRVMGCEQVTYAAEAPMEDVLRAIFRAVDGLLARHGVPPERFVSIGIAIPGIVDYRRGRLSFADTLRGWAQKPLAERFARRYRVPVVMENDVNVMALGESLLGAGKGVENLVCIWIGEGIGAGIIVDGQLVRGEAGNAGEIGYLEVGHMLAHSGRMRRLYAGQRFFGDLLAEHNLIAALRNELAESMPEGMAAEMELLSLLKAGDVGEPRVRQCLEEYAYGLAALCMTVVKTLNPTLIVLSGRVVEHSAYLVSRVRAILVEEMANIPFRASTLAVGKLKEEAGIRGAIALALLSIFEPPMVMSRNHQQLQMAKFCS
ncbi:MAG: ROK family transcriptional regulator [bacterium]|nr:ROK family protein [candidate division KSB1 bacterium]MDH7559284.1 ROK family transcriptional regulator [bacterium]